MSTADRVTEKAKDPKQVAPGRASAGARKVKQKRLLEQLQAAKELFRPGDSTSSSIPPKKADSKTENAQMNSQNKVTGPRGS